MEYWRPLKITNLSAEDLKDVRLVFKMKVYMVVSVSGDPFIDPKEEYFRTRVDGEGKTNPSWDTHLNFILHEPSLQNNCIHLTFHFHSDRRPLGVNGYVGETRVPVKDLLNNHNMSLSLACYPVTRRRHSSGRKQGRLRFSFTFGDVFASPTRWPPPPQHVQFQQQVVVTETQHYYDPPNDQYAKDIICTTHDHPIYQAYAPAGSSDQQCWSPTPSPSPSPSPTHDDIIMRPYNNNMVEPPPCDPVNLGHANSASFDEYLIDCQQNRASLYHGNPFCTSEAQPKMEH